MFQDKWKYHKILMEFFQSQNPYKLRALDHFIKALSNKILKSLVLGDTMHSQQPPQTLP